MVKRCFLYTVLRWCMVMSCCLLGACGGNTPARTESVPTGVIATTNIAVTSPTTTATPLPTQPLPTLSPTPTRPLATLGPEEAQVEVAKLMETNANCTGVCFWGIVPGVTSFDQAIQLLTPLASGDWDDAKDPARYHHFLFFYKDKTITVPVMISHDEGVVQSIHVGYVYLPAIADTKDGAAFKADRILKTYGKPDRVSIILAYGPEGLINYDLIISYDQMYIEYAPNQDIFLPQTVAHVCPLDNKVWNYFELWVGDYERDMPKETKDILQNSIDITQVSSLSVDDFYQLLTGSDDREPCFDIDYAQFITP